MTSNGYQKRRTYSEAYVLKSVGSWDDIKWMGAARRSFSIIVKQVLGTFASSHLKDMPCLMMSTPLTIIQYMKDSQVREGRG